MTMRMDRGGEWTAPIGDWLAWLRSGALRPQTIELRAYQLRRFARDHADVGPFDVDTARVAEWVGGHGWSRETIRSNRAALRSFYGWAHDSGITGSNPARLLRKVPAAPVTVRPAADDVIDAAMRAADDRLRLMLMLGSRHGLRRAEIAAVHTRDVIRDLKGHSLVVHGKGGKGRIVPLLPPTVAVLAALPAGYAFPSPGSGHLTPAHVGKLVRRALSAAAGDRVTTHQLRHRYADTIYRATRELGTVQELMGHASPATTRIYIHTTADDKRRVAATAA